MKKTITKNKAKKVVKEVTNKVAKKVVKTIPKIEEKKGYHLVLRFNDQVHEFYTENLEETILSVSPMILKTKLMVKIEKDGKACERQFFGLRARSFFRNKLFLKLFLKKIFFK